MRLLSPVLALAILLTPVNLKASENPAIWAGPYQLSMEKQYPTIDSRLNILISSQLDEKPIPVWVFFTDKEISSAGELNEKLSSAERNLTSAAFRRRVKARGAGNAVDFRDLPVSIAYIDEVLSTGAQLRHTLRWFNAVTVDAAPSQIEVLATFPFVRYVKAVAYSTSDVDIKLSPIPPDMTLVSLDYGPSQGQLEQINVIVAHELGFKGQDVIVCMMDTGYRQGHEAFQNIIDSGRLIAQYDFVNDDDNTDYEEDQDSWGQPNHGTLTWSTLGGESEGNLYGPAYLASFVLSKSEDISSEHHIEEDNWAAGAEWADSIGASVISASLGYRYGFDYPDEDYTYEDMDGNTTIVTIAADLAAYNGIAVATAQGNNGSLGPGSLLAPADGDSVIACGAVDPNGYLAGFSALGPTFDGRIKPEVCAQGISTVCADPGDFNGYTTAGGTSLSTPLIGGACAVLLSAHPNWTPMMVREALMMTADRSDDPDNDYGWGIADVGRALYYHPEGDMVFDHRPDVMVRAGQTIPVSVTISSGATITDAYLYYRIGDSGDFTQITMNTSDNVVFYAEIPGQGGGELQYYFEAVDENGSYAFDPLGGSGHPYSFGLDESYVEDSFEDGIQLWRSGGTNDRWGLTTEYARTGNLSITDSPTTYYDDDTDSWLESTFGLDLTNVSGAEITFYYRGVLQSDQDFLYLEASTDGGATWDPFPESITGSESFVEYTASLAGYAGNPDVRLRFHLVTNSSGQSEGIYIDDVSITWSPTDIPIILSVVPSQNELNVFPNSDISVTFNIDMDESTINSSTFVVNGRSTGLLEGTITYDGPTKTATFDPLQDIQEGEAVTVVLTTGIQSSGGIPLERSYAWAFTIAVDGGTGTFADYVDYDAGEGTWSIFAADLDGDGDLDLATANAYSNNSSVLLNDGDGTFAAHTDYPVGEEPWFVTAADLDGDGHIDLATANMYSEDVSVLLNYGDGTFAPQSVYPVGEGPVSVIASDVDGDGDMDLAVANLISGTVSVLLNLGNGSFAPQSQYPAGDTPMEVYSADLDGDGDLDLATANYSFNNVTVLLNNGDGSFAAYTPYEVGDLPLSVYAADLDADGDLDLAASNCYSQDISILLNDGDGIFAPQTTYSTGECPWSVKASDLDGDGDLDLVTSNEFSYNVSILLNNGDGSFAPHIDYAVGEEPYSVFAADLDGDGDIDLATANHGSDNVSVLLNKASCEYLAGDCNHNGTPLELGDVIAMIGLYRGTVDPYYTCDCPPHGEDFAPEADPNGNCVAFELGDVVTEIAAYRGSTEASGCEDCPGSRRIGRHDEDLPIVNPTLKFKTKISSGKHQP